LADLRPNTHEAERRRAKPPLVLVLPGSRSSEIRLLLSVFGDAIARVGRSFGAMEIVLPTMPHLAERVRAGVAEWAIKPRIVTEPAEKWVAFRGARAALAASGTVTLELALAGVPTVAAYRVTFIEEIVARLARIKQRLASVILANLVLGENIVPEFLQYDCTPERLAAALVPLLSDTPEWRRQTEAFARLDDIMALKAMPSAEAAAVVLDAARAGPL
jgi:lipid-A-disaccharide synthase